MARRKKYRPPLLHRASNKLFQTFPVTDQGIKVEKERLGWFLFAERNALAPVNRYQNNNPYIAEITGLDPTYRYARRFLSDRQREVFGRAAHLFRTIDKPLLLNIWAHESDYYVLRADGEKDVKLERIARDTVDELLEADATAKLGNPFFTENQMQGGDLRDIPQIRETLRDMNAVTIAYNNSLDRLIRMRGREISDDDYETARHALEEWYHRVQQEHLTVRANPPPAMPSRELRGPGVVGNQPLTGNEERLTLIEYDIATVTERATDIERQLSPLLEDYPPARRKKKPKDYQKQGYKAPILVAGKRRINLKDLK